MSYSDRLRKGQFISPSGIEIDFYFDDLQRSKERKSAIVELINSNESIAQDSGLFSDTYEFSIYFTGQDYDLSADLFYQMLSEKYSQENSGILKHPRWGNIPVMPIAFNQSESFVSNVQRAIFEITFRKVWPSQYPILAENQASEITAVIDDNQITDDHKPDFVNQMTIDRETGPDIGNKISGMFTTAKNAVLSIFDGFSDDAAEKIKDLSTLENSMSEYVDDIARNIFNALGAIQRVMRLPADIQSNLKQKIEGYVDMIAGIITLMPEESDNDKTLKTVSLCFAVMAMSESNLTIDMETRTDSLYVIDKTQEQLQIVSELGIDHDYISAAYSTVSQVVNLLLLQMFDLRIEKRKVLTIDSNPIALFYKETGGLNLLEEFMQTNHLVGDEFLNIQAGTEVVFYG